MSSKAFLLFLIFLFLVLVASATDEAPSYSIRPVAAFTANVTSGPVPLVVRFTDSSTGGIPTTWHWDTGDGIYSKHAMNATHTFTKPGVYTVTLTVTNEAGSDTVSKTDFITVYSTSEAPAASNIPEKPTAIFTADVTTGYAPLGVQFTSKTTGNPTSYYWIFEPETSNDWNSHHPVTAVHTFKNPGIYTVSLVVTNSAGSYTVTEPNYITVLDPSAPTPAQKPAASFTADVTSGKAPLEVRFTDISTGGEPASWYWNFGDGTHSRDAKTATHTFTNPGTYTVTLTVTNDSGSDTVSKTDYITVSSPLKAPIANFYSTQVQQAVLSGKSLSVPATVSFIDCSTGSPTSWFWDFGDGKTSAVQSPIHIYDEAGSYTVKLTVSNDVGSNTISKPDYVLTSVKEQLAYIQTDSVSNNHQTNTVNDNRQATTVNNNYQITNVNNNYNSNPSTEPGESTSTERPAPTSASVSLHGEKTNVVNGEEVLLKLSVVNLITKPTMHVQVIIIPPSGMSVSSSEFAESGAGQYMAKYYLEPGEGKDIEVRIVANQVGNFGVNGRVVYYFGEDKKGAEDYVFNLPIQVKEAPDIQPMPEPTPETFNVVSGFEVKSLVLIILVVFLLRRN